jgi:hypothetical protein
MVGIQKRLVWACVGMLAIPCAAPAQSEALAKMRKAFAAGVEKATLDSREKLDRLDGVYAEALARLRKKAQSDGDLDGLLALKEETKRFQSDGSVTEGDLSNASAALLKLQQSFIASRGKAERAEAEAVVALAEKYDAALEALQTKLTRDDKLEEALATKQERNQLASHPSVSAARFALADAAARKPPPPSRKPKPKPIVTQADHEAEIRRRHRTFYQSLAMRSTGSATRYVLPEDVRLKRAAVTTRLRQVVDLVATLKKVGLIKHLTEPPEVTLRGTKEASVPTPFVQTRYGSRQNPPSRWVLVDGKWYIDVFSN